MRYLRRLSAGYIDVNKWHGYLVHGHRKSIVDTTHVIGAIGATIIQPFVKLDTCRRHCIVQINLGTVKCVKANLALLDEVYHIVEMLESFDDLAVNVPYISEFTTGLPML